MLRGVGRDSATRAGHATCTPRRGRSSTGTTGGCRTTLDDLLALPGIGPYTSRAVLVFAFERDDAVVDTNVARVLARTAGSRLTRGEAQATADSLVPLGDGVGVEPGDARPRRDRVHGRAHRGAMPAPVAPASAWAASRSPGARPGRRVGRREPSSGGVTRAPTASSAAACCKVLGRSPVARAVKPAMLGLADVDEARLALVLGTLATEGLVVHDEGGWRLP